VRKTYLVNEPIDSFLVFLVDGGSFDELALHIVDMFGFAEDVADWRGSK